VLPMLAKVAPVYGYCYSLQSAVPHSSVPWSVIITNAVSCQDMHGLHQKVFQGAKPLDFFLFSFSHFSSTPFIMSFIHSSHLSSTLSCVYFDTDLVPNIDSTYLIKII